MNARTRTAAWSRPARVRRRPWATLRRDLRSLVPLGRWKGPAEAPPRDAPGVRTPSTERDPKRADREIRHDKLRVEGYRLDRLSPGGLVVVANHPSAADASVLWRLLRPRKKVLVMRPRGERTRGTSVDFDAPGRAGDLMAGLLRRGWTIVTFGEGRRSEHGELGAFHPYPFELARSAAVPVVPAGIRGAYAATGSRAGGRVSVRFGDPIALIEDPNQASERVHDCVATLIAEDAHTWWQAEHPATRDFDPPPKGPAPAGWRSVWAHTEPAHKGATDEVRRIWR